MIYLFLYYHRHFTWCHYCRSYWFPLYFIFTVTSLGINLRVFSGFLCSCVSIDTSLGAALVGLPGLFFVYSPLELVPVVSVELWGINVLLVHTFGVVPFTPPTAAHYVCW